MSGRRGAHCRGTGSRLATEGTSSGSVGRRWRGRSNARGILADQGISVIGVASGKRVDAVRAVGAEHVIDRITEDVREAVRGYTGGQGAAAVFDPMGAATYETSLRLLAPRGCLITYGELSGLRLPSTSTSSFHNPPLSRSTTECVGSKDSGSSLVSYRMDWAWL